MADPTNNPQGLDLSNPSVTWSYGSNQYVDMSKPQPGGGYVPPAAPGPGAGASAPTTDPNDPNYSLVTDPNFHPELAEDISDKQVEITGGSKIPLSQWLSLTIAEQKALSSGQPLPAGSSAGLVSTDKGEFVTKFDMVKLAPADQQYLIKNGLDAFNQFKQNEYNQAVADLEQNTVLLDTGERVDRTFYNNLPTKIEDFVSEYDNPRQLLQTKGIDKFNSWAQKYEKDLAYNYAASIGANLKLFNRLAENPAAQQAYIKSVEASNIANAGLNIIATARFQRDNIQVGPQESNEWISKDEYNKLTPQMQNAIMDGGFAALDISKLNSWEKLDKYKEWGLVSPLAEYTGESGTPGEPAYSLPQGAIDWEKAGQIAALDSKGLGDHGTTLLQMLSSSTAARRTMDAGMLNAVENIHIMGKITATQERNLQTWWDGLSAAQRQQVIGQWRNAPANIQELAASIAPKGTSALPYEQPERIIQLTELFGGMSFSEFAAEAGSEDKALVRVQKGIKEMYPDFSAAESDAIKYWNNSRPEEKGKILAASLTTEEDRQKNQMDNALVNTQKWLGEKTEWAQEHISGGSNPVEQAFRGFGSGVLQLGIGIIGLGVTELDAVNSLIRGQYKGAGQKVLGVPLGMAAAAEAQGGRIFTNPVTGTAEAAGMLLGGKMLAVIPKAIKSNIALAKVLAQGSGITARAISGPDFSAFYVEPPKGIDLLASDIKEAIAQNKELAHEILYDPKTNKISQAEQVTMLKKMLNPESQLRLDTGLDIVKDIQNGPAAPKAMYADVIDVLATVKTVPSRAIAQAITVWARKSPIEIGGSTAELAQAKGIANYHVPNDVDYYVLKGSVADVSKTFIEEIAKVVGKNNVRVTDGAIEIKYKGKWINHGTIHTTTDFGTGLPFGVKARTVKINGITFMDYREQALRRFRSIITPTGEGRTGVEQSWRAKDYEGWDRIVTLSSEVLKQSGGAENARTLLAKAEAFEKQPSGRKLSFDDYLVGKTGITVRELVEAVGKVQGETLTAEPISIRPPKSAEILSSDVNKIITAEIEKSKDILYSGKYSRQEQVAWIKSRLAPEERVRVETLTNILNSITDGPAMPKAMIRKVTDAFDMIDGNPGKIVSNPLSEWFKQNSQKIAVGGRVAVNVQNKGSKFAKVAGDLDIIVLDGDVGATARSLADYLNKSLGDKGEAMFGQLDKYSGLVEVWVEEFGQYMRIELHEKGMYEPHMPYGAKDNYIVVDGIKFQDLRSQLANRVDSVLHLQGLGQVDVRWSGRLKDFGNLDREMSTYAEGLAKQGRGAQAKALNLQIKEFTELPRGEEIPLDKYIENSSGIEVGKFVKGAPREQITDLRLHHKADEYRGPSSYNLIRNTSPMSRLAPDVLYMATRSRDILRGFDKEGKIVAGKMFDENGRPIKAPRPQLYGSINAAMNYLIDPITGKLPADAIIVALRTTKADIGSVIKMATRAEPLGIKKGVMRRGVLDEGTLEPGEVAYPTAPNARAMGRRSVSGGRTGETVTNFAIYGRTIPVVWSRTASALKAGLETPDEGLLKTAKMWAFTEAIKDMAHPHLPKRVKVSTSSEPIPSSSLIRFGKTTYQWRKGLKESTPKEIAEEVQKVNKKIEEAAAREANPKKVDIDQFERKREAIDKEIIDNAFKDPAVEEYFKQHARNAAEFQRMRETYIINLRKILSAVGLESAALSEALVSDQLSSALISSELKTTKLSERSKTSESASSKSSLKSAKSSRISSARASSSALSEPTSKLSVSEPLTSESAPSKSGPSKTGPSKSGPSKSAPSQTIPSKTGPSSSPPPTTETPPTKYSPPRPPQYFKKPEESKSELSKIDLSASVAWNQGKLKGRDGKLHDQYIVIHPPYGRNDKFYTERVPEGVPIVDGIKSAYDTIRKITKGQLPPEFGTDIGMMDVKIISYKEVPKLKFMPDRELVKRHAGHVKVMPRRASAPSIRTSR